MKIIMFLPLLVVSLTACQNTTQSNKTQAVSALNNSIQLDTIASTNTDKSTEAQNWLKDIIVKHFDGPEVPMEDITTKEYSEFKMDAMNVDLGLEESLTMQEFLAKWQQKFPVETHPTHIGFLISGQDWGKIVVEKCDLIKSEVNAYTFNTLIVDSEFDAHYEREITVVDENGKFLIADIIEKE